MNIYELEDTALASKVAKEIKKAKSDSGDWRKEAVEDFNFKAGNQWNTEDTQKLTTEKRPILTFNRCDVIVSAVLGMEANQRQEVKVLPRNNKAIGLAEAIDDIVDWARDYGDIGVEEAQSFDNMLTCGMGWSETRVDYEEDLDGKVIQESVNPREMYWDSTARKRNLVDKKWVARITRYSKDEIEEQWPTKDLEVALGEDTEDDILNNTILVDTGSNAYNEESTAPQGEMEKGINVTHFNWYEMVPIYRVQNPMTGQVAEMDEAKFNQMSMMMPGLPNIKQKKRKYYEAFVAQGVLLEKKESRLQRGFVYNCITGKRDEVNNSWQGLIRIIKDPQRWANKFFSTFIDILDSNAKGGIMVEIGAVADVKEFEDKWAKTDQIAWVNQGVIAQGKIAPKPVAQYPQAVDKLMEFSINSIHDVSGVNLELLGALDRGDVGMVVDSRKRSAYTILAPFFDSLKRYRATNAMLMLECIKKYIPPERLSEVLKDNLKPLVPAIQQIDLNQMSIVVSESPQSENNRYMTWLFISQTLPQLIQMGVPVPPAILEYSPLPAGLIEEWKKMLGEQQAKRGQMGDMTTQLDMAKKQSDIALAQAKAQKTAADAVQKQMETMMGQNVYGP